jgi:hypothetical protein
MGSGSGLCRTAVSLLAGSTLCSLAPRIAHAVDEIQLYNADINEVGQFSIQQHVNYTITGIPTPAYPGALISNHALNETPEFAYGVTPWLELGLYVPGAVNEQGQFLSNNIKLRTLFAIPDAAKKDFFYGLNFEYDFPSWPFVPSRFAMKSSAGAIPSGNSSSIRSSILPGASSAPPISLPPPGWRATSARTASSASSIIPASEPPAISPPLRSSRTSCSR